MAQSTPIPSEIPGSSTIVDPAVPLITTWAYPADCKNGIIHVQGGSCENSICNWGSTQLAEGYVNFPTMTDPWTWVSTSCVPPGYKRGFYFSPAKSCPKGYVTASEQPALDLNKTTYICCPSQFSSLGRNAFGGEAEDCCRYTSVTSGVRYSLFAPEYRQITTSGSFGVKTAFLQITSTAIYTYYNTSYDVTLYHPAVSVVVDASIETDKGNGGGFFLGYNLPLSIVITIAIVIASLIALSCCCCCCCCCDDGDDDTPPPSRRVTPMPTPRAQPAHLVQTVPGPILPLAASIPNTPSGCPGCSIENCSWMTGSRCCSCYDTRSKVPKEERIRDYCPTCRQHWGSLSLEKCPDSWGLDQIQCAHGRKTACASVARFEVSCCACKDSREIVLPLTVRLSSYCSPCSVYWKSRLGLQHDSLPWELVCRYCNRSLACTSQAVGDIGCCGCRDSRPYTKLCERVETYCQPCADHWANVDMHDVPKEWLIPCQKHLSLTCQIHWKIGSCCACTDSSGGSKPETVRAASYCSDCRTFWRVGKLAPPSFSAQFIHPWTDPPQPPKPPQGHSDSEQMHTTRQPRETVDNGSLVDTKPRNEPPSLEEDQDLNTTAIKFPTLRSGPTVITSSSEKLNEKFLILRPGSVPLLEDEQPRTKVVAGYEGKAIFAVQEDATQSDKSPGRDVPGFNDASPLRRRPLTVAQLRRMRDREGKQYGEPTFLVPPLR